MARDSRSRGTRMRKTWQTGGSFGATVITAAQIILSAVSNVEGSGLDFTVLRTRGQFLVTGIPDGAADEEVVGLGICVVTLAALAAGGTAMPGPINAAGSDAWLWHTFVPLDSMGLTGESPTGWGSSIVRIEVDSKGMRKLPEGYAVALVGETFGAEFASVEVAGGIRFLFGQ